MNKCLTSCRGCCKFQKDEISFAPKITSDEIASIKSNGSYKPVFIPFKNSKEVFQISLIKSKLTDEILVCPYLDEDTQKCGIYKIRPFDCQFWPFLFMYNENKEKILIAHFDKDACPKNDIMSQKKFNEYLIKNLDEWISKKGLIQLISQYPELIWDFELDTFIIKEIILE